MYFVVLTILKIDCCANILITCVKYDGQAGEEPKNTKERQELSPLQKVEVMGYLHNGTSSPADFCSWMPLWCK
jgi:hypothetical protein